MILSDSRVRESGRPSSLYSYNMTLTISPVRERDFTSYRCVAKNSIGEAEGSITLHSEYTDADTYAVCTPMFPEAGLTINRQRHLHQISLV